VHVQKVIDRALADPVYAAELAAKAGRASQTAGTTATLDSNPWSDLIAEFADSPEELAHLMPTFDDKTKAPEVGATTTTTTTTITTTTSLPCGITTTTTTTTTLTTTF
jgi:hypothetical protein